MTLLKLDGPIAFTGKIKGYTKSSLAQRIRDAGGYVVTTPNSGCSLFLVGDRAAYKKVDKAKALGLTIVEGDVLYELLEKGEVEWDDSIPTRPLDELIADARAVFDGAPSKEAWAAICALADECDDDHIDDFVAYLTPQLDAWPRVASYARDGYEFEVGSFTHSAGELRTAPSDWLTEMVQGQDHPKYALCTALSFSTTALNNALSTQLLDNPALGTIKVFDIGANLDQNVKKIGFYKKMASSPNLGSVETLMLSRAPKKSFLELAKATSLPNLTGILVRYGADQKGADLEAAIFGPWAPQLTTLGVSKPDHAKMIAARLDELPSFDTFLLGTTVRTDDSTFDAWIEAIEGGLLEPVRTLRLGVASLDDYEANKGLGRLLDAVTTDLDELDLRACGLVELKGPTGVAFAQKHILDNGLGARVGTLRVSERVSAEVCALLTGAGVDVASPGSAVSDDVEADLDFIADPAPGEAERVVANQVHVHDAMMFGRPGGHAWNTLTAVVDGLELQLDEDDFVAAIDTLEAYLEPWPEYVREVPERWYGELVSLSPSPKLRLARCVFVRGSYDDPKGVARFWGGAAAAGNMSHINVLRVSTAGNQKYWVQTLAALFRAIEPTAYTLNWKGGKSGMKALEELLAGTDLIPTGDSGIEWEQTSYSTEIEALGMREVALKITSPEQLQQVLDRTDMDHVVSLNLKFELPWPDEPGAEWEGLTATPASWARLRHLRLETGHRLPVAVYAPLVAWMSAARPVMIDDAYSSMSPYDSPITALLEAGIYARAYGSTIDLPNQVSQDQAEELFGAGRVHVAMVKLMYGGFDVPDTLDLIDAMHPTMREALKILKWPTTADELTKVDELISGLPNLAIWMPNCHALRTKDGRVPLLAALAASEASAQLAQVRTIGVYADQPKAAAAELKVLDKGVGMKSPGWVMQKL